MTGVADSASSSLELLSFLLTGYRREVGVWRVNGLIPRERPGEATGPRQQRGGRPEPSGTASWRFNRLGESIADTLHKGNHVLVDGQLVSSKYERENGKSRKAKASKFAIFWSVRANSARRLSRAEAEVPAQASAPEPASGDAPF
jgi:single-stranded DNA-binding protein